MDGEAQLDLSGAEALVDAAIGPLPPAFSDDELALAFSGQHDGQLLYVAAWGHWLHWDGCRWTRDDTLSVFDMCRVVCRDAAAQAKQLDSGKAIARKVASAPTTAAVEKLARSDRRHARAPDDFDADPWELNTPDGVVDLRNGKIRPHRREDLFTRITAVAPGGKCPRWLRFLKQITRRDKELVRYLQRLIGYTLTGVTREHAFVFLWGPGGNGKGTLLETIRAILGDYATTAMSDVFVVSRNDQHSTNVAALRGARMVVVPEVEQGREWAESRIKTLTGGDRVTARVMRGDPFEYSPQFKLWVAGNQRPALRCPDDAMKRRLHMVPMMFKPAKVDKELVEKLKAEWPGILAWAIEGCLAWQRDGLKAPKAVVDATAEYFLEQDTIQNWFAERCDQVQGSESGSRMLFADWCRCAIARGEEPGTEKAFSASLERIVSKKRTNSGVVFLNVQLRTGKFASGRGP